MVNITTRIPHFCEKCETWTKIESWESGKYIPACNHGFSGNLREFLSGREIAEIKKQAQKEKLKRHHSNDEIKEFARRLFNGK